MQQVIQGSVVPMVNGGPVKIAEIFLAKPNKDMDNAKREQLSSILLEFLRLCQTALIVNKSIIKATHLKFQTMCEQFYVKMQGEIMQLIDAGRRLQQ